ncbi:MAG: ribonucleotide reductase, partial [uncultured Solirubrobacteraceae bacterium]
GRDDRRAAGDLRGPLRAMGARQLVGDGHRLLRRPGRLARVVLRAAAPRGAVELHALLPRRGRGRRQPLAVHRRGAARGAEVLPGDPARRRGAPHRLLPALPAGGGRHRARRLDRRDARRHRGRAHLGLPPHLRAPRPDRRRAAQLTVADQPRARGDDVPRAGRVGARPARAALHRGLPRAPRRPPRLPGRDAQRRARRAAPHRLRRAPAPRPRAGGPRGPRGGGRGAPRGHPRLHRGVRPAGLEPRVHRVLRLHARGDLRGGDPLARSQAPRGRPADGGPPGPGGHPDRPPPPRARRARAGDAARGDPRRPLGAGGARPGDDGAALRLRRARHRPPAHAAAPDHARLGVPRRAVLAPARGQRLDARGAPGRRRSGRRDHPLRVRRLGRRGRWPGGPAPRAAARQAALQRLPARAVGGARDLRL